MITAIVPFRNWAVDRLETCVGHLRRAACVSEIVVVDFGSDDPLGAVPGARVVRVEADRWCLSEANNIGIAEAANEIVLKIDADVHLLLGDDALAGLAGRVASGEVDFFVLQPTDFDMIDGQRRNRRLRPSWAEGCANLFSRAAVVEIGGFDTRYFDYGGEDNDLCQRLRRYGRRVEHHLSDAVLHERHPPSEARLGGRFTEGHKKHLLADRSIFRPRPFRYSDYSAKGVFGPAITVAIATTDRPDRERHLAHCLKGLAAQTLQDFEVRICDNGSPRPARLRQAALRRAFPTLDIHLHTREAASIPAARNLITDRARGFYIAVHDDDDVSLPTRLEEQLDCMSTHDGAHGCHSGWIEFDEATGRLKSYPGQARDIESLLSRPGKITLHGATLYRRDVLARFRYDDSLVLGSDFHLHMRMILAGVEIPHTRRFHCLRRLHAASVTSTGTRTQRTVSDRTNAAYRSFVGERFLAAVRAAREPAPWVSGFPTIREMLAYLPGDFGRFRIDLDLEAALALGFDPVFGGSDAGETPRLGGIAFAPAARGFGADTRLVMRSTAALSAGAVKAALPAFGPARGVDVVSEAELSSDGTFCSLKSLAVEAGSRRVVSRRYADMAEALAALPDTALAFGLGEIGFFAVNEPEDGVHVLLGAFDNATDLEHALALANAGDRGDFAAMSDAGLRGGFGGT